MAVFVQIHHFGTRIMLFIANKCLVVQVLRYQTKMPPWLSLILKVVPLEVAEVCPIPHPHTVSLSCSCR